MQPQLASDLLTSSEGDHIDPTGKWARAHDWTGTIHSKGRFFTDDHGRSLLVRGVNLCGNAKLPTSAPGSLKNHRDVSFVGRPFRLDEADEHFKRLRGWGLTFVRLLVTWEALEHGGPGIYDEEYIDYLIKIMEKMAKYGIKCFIDPHQDTWSRYSGGSGAPGWTFEVAGMDLTTFRQVGAAHISDVTEPSTTKHQYWPTNYAKLACCTMFTLFFGGETFAPKTLYKGESVQHFLQRHFINAFAHLATRLKDCPAVIGFEVMNEPHFGYIGLPSIHHFDPLTTLHFGPFPSALESFALGSGVSLDVPFYVQSWPWPTQKAGTKRLNDEKLSAWIDGRKCIWEEHGVWKMVDGKPVPLKTDYFSKHPITGRKVNFDNDFYMPFIRNYIKAIQAVKADNLVFFEPIPNEDPPVFNEIDATMQNVVYAPHWYDLKTLFSKSWDGIITHDVRGLSRGTKNVLAATYFGISGAMKNYGGQISSIVKIGIDNVGTRPVVFGECGMPMDINKKRAFGTGDYKLHTHFMDTCLSAMETNLVYFTLWNYNPMNDNTHGDYWNGEDFSIYSPKPARSISSSSSVSSINSLIASPANGEVSEPHKKAKPGKSKLQDDITPLILAGVAESPALVKAASADQLPTTPFEITNFYFHDDGLAIEGDPNHVHHDGGRALDAIVRPYAAKIAGMPLTSRFNLRKLTYTLEFIAHDTPRTPLTSAEEDEPPISRITEIFIPNYHFGYANGIEIKVSDGEWKFDKKKQTLYWAYDPKARSHSIAELTPLLGHQGTRHWIKISVPGYKPQYSGMFGWVLWIWDQLCAMFSK